jgi:hypothetical protein
MFLIISNDKDASVQETNLLFNLIVFLLYFIPGVIIVLLCSFTHCKCRSVFQHNYSLSRLLLVAWEPDYQSMENQGYSKTPVTKLLE